MSQESNPAVRSDAETPPPGPVEPLTVDVQPLTLPPRQSDGASAMDTLAHASAMLDRVCIPGYTLLRVLGRGGMGVVYEARQEKLNRLVALKMILSGGHASSQDLARFRAEGEALARLQHPNFVQIYEVGEHQGLPFISLEHCSGGSLAGHLNGTPIAPEKAAALVEVLARAIQIAHAQNVVHRDLKPANVLLTASGELKITDFGLAKKLDVTAHTTSGAILGTPSYMAPEQADGSGRKIGPTADVYALGAILYEALTGRPPFWAATPLDTIVQLVADEPTPPSRLRAGVPWDLETICLKCLEKEPGRRYASARALAGDLNAYLRGETITARPLSRAGHLWRWARLRPALAATLLALVLFYSNHLALLLVGVEGEGGRFHWYVTSIVAAWGAGAVLCHWLSLVPAWRPAVLFGWTALDVLMLTLFLEVGDGPRSALLMGYLLLIAGAALRFRITLVWFVTGLSMAGYSFLAWQALRQRPEVAVAAHAAIIYLMGLVIMGLMMSLLLRRVREERSGGEAKG